MKIQCAGLFWYASKADYDLLQPLFKDAKDKVFTYEQWLVAAEKSEKDARDRGILTVRANAKHHDFILWCKAGRVDINSEARRRFAAEYAMLSYRPLN